VSELDMTFAYDGVRVEMNDEAVHRALHLVAEHLDEAERTEESRDGIPFCGCEACYGRVVSGFWISWTVRMIREGKIVF
jgi:hypothetical protein